MKSTVTSLFLLFILAPQPAAAQSYQFATGHRCAQRRSSLRRMGLNAGRITNRMRVPGRR